jgi:hypothetical protein
VDGEKVTRQARLRLELASQFNDMHTHGASIRTGIVSPHFAQDDISGQGSPGIQDKEERQIIFAARYFYFRTTASDAASFEIDFDISKADAGLVTIYSSAEDRSNTSLKFALAKRLYEIVIGAQLEQQNRLHWISHRAQENDWRPNT